MIYVVRIDTARSPAFDAPHEIHEMARLLHELARRITKADALLPYVLYDRDNNVVGETSVLS